MNEPATRAGAGARPRPFRLQDDDARGILVPSLPRPRQRGARRHRGPGASPHLPPGLIEKVCGWGPETSAKFFGPFRFNFIYLSVCIISQLEACSYFSHLFLIF